MSKIDMVFETVCGVGIILTPFWLAYKFILCLL